MLYLERKRTPMDKTFTSVDDLDSYLQSHLYLNQTSDPTAVKYQYQDMLRQLEYFSRITLNPYQLMILAYGKKYYYKTDLLEVFPDNTDISFSDTKGKMSLGDLLEIDDDLGD